MPGTSAGARKGALTKKRRKIEGQGVTLKELNSGATYVSGLDINLRKIEEEYVPALTDLNDRLGIFDQMANDPKIKAQLRANILPLLSAVRWKVEGGKQEHRDLVAANLLRQGERKYWCDTSWTQRLQEHLQCLRYGFSVHGKTWANVDGYQVYSSLTYLSPKSLGGNIGAWEWDKNGRLIAIHRKYKKPDGSRETDERLKVEDLFFTVWDMTGENWEGVSLIRCMYRPWKEKDLAAKIQMIDLQNRGVGIPDAELGPNDGKGDRETLKQIAQSMRGGSKERAFIVRAHGQKVGFLTSQGSTLDSSPIIQSKNMDIASGGATDFMQQGQTASGSRASGSVQMVSYMQILDAVREIIQEQINHGAGYLQGLVEELVDANFDDVKEYPHLVGSRVSPSDQLDNVPLLFDGVQKGAITHDLIVENHIRNSLGVKELSQKEFDDIKKSSAPPPQLGGRPQEVTDFDREEPRDDTEGRRFGLLAQAGRAEKKTDPESLRKRNDVSWPWARSIQG